MDNAQTEHNNARRGIFMARIVSFVESRMEAGL